jgi:hypothetical protein
MLERLALDPLAADLRAVAAVEIAHRVATALENDLRMLAARARIGQLDAAQTRATADHQASIVERMARGPREDQLEGSDPTALPIETVGNGESVLRFVEVHAR